MFTGIILAMGRVSSLSEKGGDLELRVDAPALDFTRIAIGDSISVEGVCLTATRIQGTCFHADVSRETMDKTTLGALVAGSNVNLEPSLRVGDPLGGHWVNGHVDAVGTLRAIAEDARSWRMEFELPEPLLRFVAPKGSICVSGVSLTINSVEARRIFVNVIPHTQDVTTLGGRRVGDGVNIEIDIIARYLERLMVNS